MSDARARWEGAADRLLDALVPYATPGFAQYRLPGRAGHSGVWSDGLEGYARSFLLAAFRIAGAGGVGVDALIERYVSGLAAGTDPAHPEHWPPITDRGQPMVEAASVAVALHETRPWVWDRLPEGVRQRVVEWFGGFVGAVVNDSNWRLFQVIVEEFLASVGAPYRRAEIEAGLARLDDWYRGDGWYTDGDGQKFDYYNAWALHLYPVLWARIAGVRADPAVVARHRGRLREFLETYQYFFGGDGAPVHQGRSLTYRYAVVAPLWAGVLADATPLSPGRTRALASGALRHFEDREVPDGDGVLRLGWYREFLPVTQPYSGPASPYWAAKAFLGLLIPAGDPVWTAPEELLATEDRCLSLAAPGWLLHSTAADGIVRLVNHGSDRLAPVPARSEASAHYTRFAYSSVTAPETPPGDVTGGVDNHLAVGASRRGRIHRAGTGASWHVPLTGEGEEMAGCAVSTVSVVHGAWEVRVHAVEGTEGAVLREGGWAVAADSGAPVGSSGEGWAVVRRADGLCSAVVSLLGGVREGRVVSGEGANAYGRWSGTPVLVGGGADGVVVTLVVLTADPGVGWSGAWAREMGGGRVEVGFPDGWTEVVGVGGVDGDGVRGG
ncbi:DUF2264 domain-containing protein [Streptomyces sp. NPDC004539]|uniref:DUF2264 domain-containing protein n=1 Tax=Streptomyces sp. NPDC004539 TaxID=3154280 RepID=UPI00339E594C